MVKLRSELLADKEAQLAEIAAQHATDKDQLAAERLKAASTVAMDDREGLTVRGPTPSVETP